MWECSGPGAHNEGSGMTQLARTIPLALSAVLLLGLAGCAAPAHKDGAHAHSGNMDMQAMCERHKKMMAGRSTAEHEAMRQEHMKTMAPEMRQRMEAMYAQCR
jgi:hypothetical protein